MARVFKAHGGVCTVVQFDGQSRCCVGAYRRRFGRWRGILGAFRAWLEANGEAFPYMAELPGPTTGDHRPITGGTDPAVAGSPLGDRSFVAGAEAMTYGPPLQFREMLHAPTNELGVVLLFGMLCRDLGFRVEAVRAAYPDCEAKRCVDRQRERWQRVRIEFEYRSAQFRHAGHDPRGCDLIVCWIHDWAKAPVEVLELRAVVAALRG
jgi:hypothetical protein